MRFIIIILLFSMLLCCTSRTPVFDQERAFRFLLDQCEIGPRAPNSAEIELCRQYIINKLKENNAVVREQDFTIEKDGVIYEGCNILASYFPRMSRRILLGAHYDTRPWADRDASDSLRSRPIIGANDAASGVAILLEISSVLARYEPQQVGVDLIFFDLEDMGEYGKNETWCLGSQYYAENYSSALPEKAIIIDMVGDKNLELYMEYFSYHNAPALTNEIWFTARDLGFRQFKARIGKRIYDDHYPLIQSGFNAVDIIDFDYEYWHTTEDTPDKCSEQSLYVVGQTLLELIFIEK
ncbi:MAG: M28 family peptidase [Candidatus Cloacimonetes bacterium]|nr:M28 family peptidase [Candidatus Cloacimonadota bacterium]